MAETNVVENVSTGSPKIGGYAFRAPIGTTIPADASSDLAEAYKVLGYISEDGVTNATDMDTDSIKDWGGTPVLNVQGAKEDTFQFTLIESKNLEALKTVYGDENVTGTLDTGITIKANAKELEEHIYVFEMVMRGNVKKRVVIPDGKVTEIGDITYVNNEAVGYEVTVTCAADSEGNTHYEYMCNPTATS